MVTKNVFTGKYAEIHELIKKAKYDSDGIKFVYKLLLEFGITKNDIILDVCCGEGQDMQYLANQGVKVEGVDLSPDMLSHAKDCNPESKLYCAKAEEFNLDDPRYKAAYCLTSFGMLDNPKQAAERISKVLLDNGLFIFDYWNVDAFEPGTKEYIETVSGLERRVIRTVKDAVCTTRYFYPSAKLEVEHEVKLFDLWSLRQTLVSWYDIVKTYSNYTYETPDWHKDKYVTVVAKLRGG